MGGAGRGPATVYGVNIAANVHGVNIARSYHHGALRSALVAAGIEALDEGGALALSLREMARRVGVSPNAAYRHFASKDELLSAIAARGFAELADAFAAVEGSAPNAREGMIRLGHGYVAFARARPNLFRLMFGGAYPLDVLRGGGFRIGGDAFDALLASVARARDARTDDPAVLPHAVRVWSIVHGYAMLLIDGRLPKDAETQDFFDRMLRDQAMPG